MLLQEAHITTLRLPFPPSSNQMWRHNNGRTHLSHEARNYYKTVRGLCDDTAAGGLFMIPAGVALRLEIVLWLPQSKMNVRDLDNCVKVLQDALFKASTNKANDARIWELVVEKRSLGPCEMDAAYCEVELSRL